MSTDNVSQMARFPATRYMGSKTKLLSEISGVTQPFGGLPVIDMFSGSAAVSYLLKTRGHAVTSNDYMVMSHTFAKAMVENQTTTVSEPEIRELLNGENHGDQFVSERFAGLYFSDEDNAFIDRMRSGIASIGDEYKRAIAMTALIRACMKKRPRGIFTYVGNRYDDGRRDLSLTFEEHFQAAVQQVNGAVFDNGLANFALNQDALELEASRESLVYIDPPYYSPHSDNEYVRRYHFVEGLARNWEGVEIQEGTLTKKFKSYPTPFSSKKGANSAFQFLFERHRDSVMIVSYSSNSLPSLDEMVGLLESVGKKVQVVPVSHRYSAGNHGHKVGDNRNEVTEYLFVAE